MTISEPSPATNLQLTKNSVNSLKVTWNGPDGFTGQYEIQLKEGTVMKENITRNTTQQQFGGLKAGTQYTVIVVTVINSQRGAPLTKKFYTSKWSIIHTLSTTLT